MRKEILLASAFSVCCLSAPAQIGIGAQSPDPSAQLEVISTQKGFLTPRMTSAQRTSIASPADGLLVYDTDTKNFWLQKAGTGWVELVSFQLPVIQTISSASTTLFSLTTQQNTPVAEFKVDLPTGTSPAVKGEVNSYFSNYGTAGIMGVASGTGGYAGYFHQNNPGSGTPAVWILTDGTNNALNVRASQNGNGLEAYVNGSGSAVYGYIPNTGTGRAARFRNLNTANGNPAIQVDNAGTGSAILVNHTGASGNMVIYQNAGTNVARINKAGTGYFNGGTQSSGADLAEKFDVTGETASYEPGDVLVISTEKDRTVEKSTEKYSALVLGVYATRPGVILTDEDINATDTGRVPMGVVGVIPTKVCAEGGPIRRGDLLVTSSQKGVAMKADPALIQPGQLIGKALQNYDGPEVQKINVFVNVK